MEKHIFTSFNAADLKSLVKAAIREVNSENKSKNFQNEIPEDFLDQRETAKFLRISYPTLIRWKKEKKIPYYQEGRTILFKKSELLDTLRKNESFYDNRA